MKIFAEILGFLAVGIGFFIFQQKDRKKILVLKMVCDFLWAVHFLMLGALTGMALSLTAAFRAIVFSRVDIKKNKKNILWLFLFLSINVVSITLLWNSVWSICSLISGLLATIAYWQTSPNRIKVLALFVCVSQITYAIAMGSYASSLNELITMLSIALFFIRYARSKKHSANINENETNTEEKV